MIGVRRREGTYVSGLLLILLVVIRHTVQWSPPQPNLGDIRFFLEPDIRLPFGTGHPSILQCACPNPTHVPEREMGPTRGVDLHHPRWGEYDDTRLYLGICNVIISVIIVISVLCCCRKGEYSYISIMCLVT